MATSRDYNELKYAWKGWYEAAGRPIKDQYEEFVALSNKASEGDGKYRRPNSIFFKLWRNAAKFHQPLPILNSSLHFSNLDTDLSSTVFAYNRLLHFSTQRKMFGA